MNYKIDCKHWGRFFSVPCSVVDDYILVSDGDFVKVLLCILCSNTNLISTDDLARQSGISEDRAEDAIIHWTNLGVITAETVDGKSLAVKTRIKSVNSPENSYSKSGEMNSSKNATDAKTRVKYSTREIAEKIDSSDELKALFDDIQRVLKRIINGTEMAAILNLYEYYDYSAASILMIAEYCMSLGKGKMAYIETVAKDWFDQGICSYAEVEAEIIRQSAQRTFETKVIRAFGIENKITKRQREFIQNWRNMGFSVEMLAIAYEKCMNATNKLNFGYINKILETWSGKNIKTPAQVDEDDSAFSKKTKADRQDNKDTSYDLSEWEKYAMNFNPVKSGEENS